MKADAQAEQHAGAKGQKAVFAAGLLFPFACLLLHGYDNHPGPVSLQPAAAPP